MSTRYTIRNTTTPEMVMVTKAGRSAVFWLRRQSQPAICSQRTSSSNTSDLSQFARTEEMHHHLGKNTRVGPPHWPALLVLDAIHQAGGHLAELHTVGTVAQILQG